MGPGGVNDVIHRKRAQRILGIWEKSVSWVLASEEDGWLSGLAEARPVVCSGGRAWWWWWWGEADGKVSIERLCITLLMSKNLLTQKVIKSFVPELRSRRCFCVSGFLLSIYMSYEHSMYISHIYVWVCYTSSFIHDLNSGYWFHLV